MLANRWNSREEFQARCHNFTPVFDCLDAVGWYLNGTCLVLRVSTTYHTFAKRYITFLALITLDRFRCLRTKSSSWGNHPFCSTARTLEKAGNVYLSLQRWVRHQVTSSFFGSEYRNGIACLYVPIVSSACPIRSRTEMKNCAKSSLAVSRQKRLCKRCAIPACVERVYPQNQQYCDIQSLP